MRLGRTRSRSRVPSQVRRVFRWGLGFSGRVPLLLLLLLTPRNGRTEMTIHFQCMHGNHASPLFSSPPPSFFFSLLHPSLVLSSFFSSLAPSSSFCRPLASALLQVPFHSGAFFWMRLRFASLACLCPSAWMSVTVTVAILAQGTHWAVALAQVSCTGLFFVARICCRKENGCLAEGQGERKGQSREAGLICVATDPATCFIRKQWNTTSPWM